MKMTQDEIIEMAEQSGLHATLYFRKEQLREFAKLVAAKEREACAKICDDLFSDSESISGRIWTNGCAEAIRARGEA
jgi:hypothetical protein